MINPAPMTNLEKFQRQAGRGDAACIREQVLVMRQPDIKPMLKVLAGICIFFAVMAAAAVCGATVVVLIKSLIRLF
jgi:hypothetical protein